MFSVFEKRMQLAGIPKTFLHRHVFLTFLGRGDPPVVFEYEGTWDAADLSYNDLTKFEVGGFVSRVYLVSSIDSHIKSDQNITRPSYLSSCSSKCRQLGRPLSLFHWSEMSADHHQHYKDCKPSQAVSRSARKSRFVSLIDSLVFSYLRSLRTFFTESVNLFRETGGSNPSPSPALNADVDAGQSPFPRFHPGT